MQLVLLSGGSGQRLWPLSNNARSKQFLPLLDNGGKMESMLQRVVRQANANLAELNGGFDITIATNASQLDIIRNQLGDAVDVVTEPQRRDTFPAIALAACYLKLEKHCSDDEVVVIMPCDPYTEDGYFRTIGTMAECVLNNVAELVLMGITPTYPSTKYGYVVPAALAAQPAPTKDGQAPQALRVEKFTEKPQLEAAEQLLKKGALWNGGVFAFRLGYIYNIARPYLVPEAASFAEVRARYTDFPKISFDYEVAEKAQSVAVVPFKGQWKDLGTWNTLTEELGTTAIGNAVMGPDCSNTHIINELHHPIYADGLKDIVIAASPDGILVCRKDRTEGIKNAVASLTPRPMYEERRWGFYRVLDDTVYPDGHHSLTKSITINPGKFISYQRHQHRLEVWTIVQGEGLFVFDGKLRRIAPGDSAVIPAGHLHAVKAISPLTIIEVQSGDPLIEEDIERFDLDWASLTPESPESPKTTESPESPEMPAATPATKPEKTE